MSRDETAWLSRIADPAGHGADNPLLTEVYEASPPSYQNAIDLLPGWNAAFPPEMKLTAGPGYMYEDPRIHWAAERSGGLEGKRVLELGPLEGAHTYLLERLGAKRIDAIEANKLAYLRCLVAKEIFGLRRARFHLGDFVRGLEAPTRYDLIVACGVLYHMTEPLTLLERIAGRTDLIYLWTHYFDDEEMPLDRRPPLCVPRAGRRQSGNRAIPQFPRRRSDAASAQLLQGVDQDAILRRSHRPPLLDGKGAIAGGPACARIRRPVADPPRP